MTNKIISPFIEIPANKNSLAQRKLVFGIGTNDSKYIVNPLVNDKTIYCPYYSVWKSMLMRCYSDNYQSKHPTYIGCTTAKEWHIFSSFKKWMADQDWEGKELDKDVLIIGNKIYSPETCIFVSHSINSLLCYTQSSKSTYPIGVSFNKKLKKFSACFNLNGKQKYLGLFATQEKADKAYKIAKSDEIMRIALFQTSSIIKGGLIRHAEHLLNE